ncbi:MAG: spore germination protein [Clostridia bacterium]|nr:spore germination protein [Clostridia bacterium]
MRFFDEIVKRLGFDRGYADFELLETESGVPPADTRLSGGATPQSEPSADITPDLRHNRRLFARLFHRDINSDAIFRSFITASGVKGLAVYLNGMVDADRINDFILRPLVRKQTVGEGDELLREVLYEVLEADEIAPQKSVSKIADAIASGQAAVFIDGVGSAIIADVRGFATRSIGEAENEKTIMGSKEAFTENLRTSITQLRRIVKSPDLIAELRASNTSNKGTIAILYMAETVNITLLENIKRKIASIDTTMLLDVGTLAQLIERPKYIPLPKTLITEKPDRVAAHLLQGHIAIVIDGSPESLVLPATLFSLMASADDAYIKGPLGSIIRLVRFAGAAISILLPGGFVALALYHQGLLSTEVLLTVISARKMVHIPIGFELLFLMFVFHLIREAGMRVPGSIGQAIGIIGGLMLGQAAVTANIVSTTSLIVVALSGLGNFCIPNYQLLIATSWLRVILLLAGWAGGLLGLTCAIIVMIGCIASMKSFGVPYLSPYAPTAKRLRPAILRGTVDNHDRPADYMNTREDRGV